MTTGIIDPLLHEVIQAAWQAADHAVGMAEQDQARLRKLKAALVDYANGPSPVSIVSAATAALPEDLRGLPLVEAVRCLRDGLDAAQEAAFKCCSRNAWGDGEHDPGCKHAAMKRALAAMLDWFGRPGENVTVRYDAKAEAFYQETRIMAPGKSEPMEWGGRWTQEERQRAWDAWLARRREEIVSAAAALCPPAPDEDR